MSGDPGVALRPAYSLSKLTAAAMFQLIAQDVSAEQLQIVGFHPGLVFNETWSKMGLPSDMFPHGALTKPHIP